MELVREHAEILFEWMNASPKNKAAVSKLNDGQVIDLAEGSRDMDEYRAKLDALLNVEVAKAKLKKISSFGRTTLYQYKHTDDCTYNVEVESIRDKHGLLKRVQCSLTGFFETYGNNEVIIQALQRKIK